jgi:hypothetical protein
MNALCAHAGVQEAACRALCALAVNEDNQIYAGSAGAIKAVVAGMSAHGMHAGVQEHACFALASMAANQTKAGSAGAIEAVVTAMNVHGAHAGVQPAVRLLGAAPHLLGALSPVQPRTRRWCGGCGSRRGVGALPHRRRR